MLSIIYANRKSLLGKSPFGEFPESNSAPGKFSPPENQTLVNSPRLIFPNIFSNIETILNVFSNYIPHEILTCNDKDPPWFTLGLNLFYRLK